MAEIPVWWKRPRRVAVVVDNPSWILPYAKDLVAKAASLGDDATLLDTYDAVPDAAVCFFLGCIHIAPASVLRRAARCLVVHESNLPKGRGMSPLTWQIIEGAQEIPICLIEAAEKMDSGAVIYRDVLEFSGHELLSELRRLQGLATAALCSRYLEEDEPPQGKAQTGTATFYRRRTAADSALDPTRSLAEQFDLLRTVNNKLYPAFFDFRGQRYWLTISKSHPADEQG